MCGKVRTPVVSFHTQLQHEQRPSTLERTESLSQDREDEEFVAASRPTRLHLTFSGVAACVAGEGKREVQSQITASVARLSRQILDVLMWREAPQKGF